MSIASNPQTEHKIQVQRGEGEGNGTLGRSKIVLGTGQSYEDPGEGGGGRRVIRVVKSFKSRIAKLFF